MTQPFWKLNAGLLLVVCSLLGIMFFLKIKLQRPYPMAPAEVPSQAITQRIEFLDSSKIYQNDLFNTYISHVVKPEKQDYVKPVPPPPPPVIVTPPPIEPPKFLDPLPITLTGIFMLNDEAKNRAIIINNKTKEEITYKVGDEIEDAQIVKIFPQKVLLIRSNGQQEIIYLSQDTATTEAIKFAPKNWSRIVKKISTHEYLVDRQEFINEVATLSNFIDLFNLATAYKQGKSIGIKIGNFENSSLPSLFGFNPGDILTTINNTSITTTDERFSAYKEIAKLAEGATITLKYLRDGQLLSTTIKLGSLLPTHISISKAEPKETTIQKAKIEKEQQLNLLRQKEKFAPTLRDIRLHEKENIIRHQKAVEARKRRGRADD